MELLGRLRNQLFANETMFTVSKMSISTAWPSFESTGLVLTIAISSSGSAEHRNGNSTSVFSRIW
jgi:hypothetical protein